MTHREVEEASHRIAHALRAAGLQRGSRVGFFTLNCAPALVAMIGNEVALVVIGPPAALPHIQAGRVKALAVMRNTRLASLPQVPTTQEAGVKDVEAITWYGMLAPAGTPREIITRLHAEVVKAVGSAEVRERFQGFGSEPVGSSPDEFATQIKNDIAKWAKVAKTANVRAD